MAPGFCHVWGLSLTGEGAQPNSLGIFSRGIREPASNLPYGAVFLEKCGDSLNPKPFMGRLGSSKQSRLVFNPDSLSREWQLPWRQRSPCSEIPAFPIFLTCWRRRFQPGEQGIPSGSSLWQSRNSDPYPSSHLILPPTACPGSRC